MLYLFVALKIPILLLGCIVWWAVRQDPASDEAPEDDGGSKYRRPHAPRPLPRTPRRGPHGDPAPVPPPRVRPVTARARQLER
jgi:hypothetical protein